MSNKIHNLFHLFFLATLIFLSCKKEVTNKIGTDEFILQDGFEIELVAAEPLLDSPVAMQFDEKGRIWVVELPGYMRDIDGTDEDLNDGKIVVLSDNDGDGQMDKRSVFLDGLTAPRALLLVYGGILYTDNTSLWWASIENDLPNKKTLVDSLYVIGGNIEHQPNGLLYHVDNWIYSAKSNARYKLKNGQWLKEPTLPRGQWGLTADDEGRLFYNDNSNPLMGDLLMPNTLIANPFQKVKHGVYKQVATDRRVFPYQATAVNRGYEEGTLDTNGLLMNFTSACGPLIYRGDQFPDEYYGNAFVCGPEANLVKRYILVKTGHETTAKQAYLGEEFLVSKDESFRPVNLYNAPDGALYIVDLRQGVIQHRAYMTSYLREKILERGLEKINGIGRIYRVKPKNNIAQKNTPEINSKENPTYFLGHKNSQLRINAQHELLLKKNEIKNDQLKQAELAKILFDKTNPLAQIHTMWLLYEMDLLQGAALAQVVRHSENPMVVNHAMRIAALANYPKEIKSLAAEKAINLSPEKNNLYVAHLLGNINDDEADSLWVKWAEKYSNDPIVCEALISGVEQWDSFFLAKIPHLKNDSIYSMLSNAFENRKKQDIKAPQFLTEIVLDDRTAGFRTYNTYCLSCHGQDGRGNPNLAPPLYPSEYVQGKPERMIALALQGLKGPIHVNRKKYEMSLVMPGIKNNPDLTDKKIADLMIFIKNSFSEEMTYVGEETVREIREKLGDREEMFTEESLEKWLEENGYN